MHPPTEKGSFIIFEILYHRILWIYKYPSMQLSMLFLHILILINLVTVDSMPLYKWGAFTQCSDNRFDSPLNIGNPPIDPAVAL